MTGGYYAAVTCSSLPNAIIKWVGIATISVGTIRHCERSEAIQKGLIYWIATSAYGLLAMTFWGFVNTLGAATQGRPQAEDKGTIRHCERSEAIQKGLITGLPRRPTASSQ